MGAEESSRTGPWRSFHVRAAWHFAGARDGTLCICGKEPRLCYAALFLTCANTDWNIGGVHSHSLPHPVACGALRYWDCRAYRGLCSSSSADVLFAAAIEAFERNAKINHRFRNAADL